MTYLDPAPAGVFTARADTVWGLGSYDAPALRFNGTDEYGVDWVLGKVDGWKTTTADTPVVRANGADGGWFGPGTRAPKVLTLTGAFRANAADAASVRAQLDAAELRLRAAVEHLAEDTWLWHTGVIPKQMTVRLTGACVVDDASQTVRTFSAVLTAADPLKYAAGAAGLVTLSTGLGQGSGSFGLAFPAAFPANFGTGVTTLGGRIAATNPGSQPVYPLVTFAGPVDTPVLRHLGLGQSQGVATALATGSAVVVDHRARSVVADGRSVYAQRLGGSVFFPLAPGGNDLTFTANAYTAAALVTVSFRPAWS